MKKFLAFLFLSSLLLLAGCGGDDEVVDPPNPTPTLTANKTAASPSITNPNDAVWGSVSSIKFDLSGTNAPKLGVSKATAVADTVSVQAIVSNDSLFMRFVWDDESNSVWRDYFEITTLGPPILFSQNNSIDMDYNEDQLFVMFDGSPNGGWDVWNWRALTTGAAGFAEGFQLLNNSLTRDNGQVTASSSNPSPFGTQPSFVHEDTAEYNGHVLALSNIANFTTDTTSYGNYINLSQGWIVGQRIPGWLIDDNAKNRAENERLSRLDTRAVDSYSNGTYTLVLVRKLNTGYDDDKALVEGTTVTLKIAVLNNQNEFTTGSSNRAFTRDINLVL